MVTRSGVGRTCTTDRPAGISGNKRRDKEGDQGSRDARLIWGSRAWSCIPLHQNRGRAPVVIVLAALSPAIGASGVAVWTVVEAQQRSFEARLHDTARALGLAVDADLAGRLATLEAFATSAA